ncbi:putative PIG3 family NAD(P)H quinone oxidoreductase [Branchiibius hedensis]|uniref:Putative NAD(P)H quinone oxidoreductase, PIG3 family n=1 Tax=Branchiibius hedensis TaxID=672460 RepID=A0A2Y9C278_9MICO|nr:NAD(P)H-quinone oxidoreductase [Branchiibius hedensis]PWJ26812.1 putative PIG3 family NAD(P)H quinone oxidoreductase [Branchiibius hedensis]SSA35623.1 putative NAD(P)H quinone oxidoreductase, PIG3 family [Branchiibius hedensis]
MRAITIPEFGDEDVLTVSEVPDLTPGPGEVLIEVAAAGVNRADLMQRQGFYPPPPGISEVPGLEVSGTITAVGEAAAGWVIGDEVCALLAGGGYAQQVVVPAGQVLPVPAGVSLQDAAALPEVACTVWSNIVMTAHLKTGDLFLQHGGSSGIGTMAIQIAGQLGARIAVTAGSQEKLDACAALGADILINYREQDFVEVIQEAGGADVILDVIGAKYLSRNVTALADGGRLVIIGLQGGTKAELDINQLLVKRGTVAATSLRSRSLAQKAAIVGEVREHVWPLIAQGKIRPIVSETFPLEDAARAHRALQESQHIGKILLTV